MFENMSYKARKRWAIVVLLVGMPLYVVVSVTVVNLLGRTLGRPPIWLEFVVYVVLGFLWIVPFRGLFRGIGQPDPDQPGDDG